MANLELKEEISFEEFSRYFDNVLNNYGLEETKKIKCERIRLYNKYCRYSFSMIIRYKNLVDTYFKCLNSSQEQDRFYDLDALLGLTPQKIRQNKN